EIGNVIGQYAVTPQGTVGLDNVSAQTAQAIKDMMAVTRTNLYEEEFSTITSRAIANNALVSGALAQAPKLNTVCPNTTLGNHHVIVGGAVQGRKIYGTFPRLAALTPPGVFGPDDTGVGRWIPTTSVEEYSATLAKWFGVSPTDMPTVFPNLGRFGHPDLGF